MMKEYKVYTKGLEYGGLASAYAVYDAEGNIVAQGAKKFGRIVDGVEVEDNKGHFVMELLAAWSGLSAVPKGSKVTVISNDSISVTKMKRLDETMPYGHFTGWIAFVVMNRNLDVSYEWIKQGKDTVDSNRIDLFVKPLAQQAQRTL